MITGATFVLLAAAVSAQDVLERAIAYHDPGGVFATEAVTVELSETRPNGPSRRTRVHIDVTGERFEMERAGDDGKTVEITMKGDDVVVKGDPDLTPERAARTRNYYLYLYGLPMKLTDPGTRLDPTVKETEFRGREALELKVTYDEDVGGDTWYFYFDPESYAMFGYRFYHDESKNDGEYITLEGEATGKGLKLPKIRKWYRHRDDGFLGTDTIEAIR